MTGSVSEIMGAGESVRCPHCQRTFGDQNGLWMHVKAKHGKGVAKALKPKPADDGESMGDFYRDMKDRRRAARLNLGRECPRCPPNRCATILMPGQTCRVDGYQDERQAAAKARVPE